MTSLPRKRKIADLDGIRKCPSCGNRSALAEGRKTLFASKYVKDSKVSADIFFWVCMTCDFEYPDESIDELMHFAVCEHLERLTPFEIKSIRKKVGVSQEEFARLTQFGKASIKRWESGTLIQSASADQFLRLISDPDIFERLVWLNVRRIVTEGMKQEQIP